MPRIRHRHLLEAPDVRRWYNALARTARHTADNYLRTLGRFCASVGVTPSEYVRLKAKQRDDLLDDEVQRLLDAGRAGSYVETVKKAVVSWLDHNGKHPSRKIRIPGASQRPSLREAFIPSQEQLRAVLNAADARTRAAIALLAFAGQRLEVLGNFEGALGLRLRDLVDLRLGAEMGFDKVPARIVISGRLSKTGREYFTFLGHEGAEYVLAYLNERRSRGERLEPDSAFLAPTPRQAVRFGKAFIRTPNVSKMIRKPMRAAGLALPPYIWRSYFSSRAMLAEAKGFMREWREFAMGHSGGVAETYSLHKRLPPDTVEAMRAAYSRALEFLETTKTANREDELRTAFRRQILLLAGVPEAEIEKMDLVRLGDADIQAIVRDRLVNRGPANGGANGNGGKQKVVPLSAVETYLAEGWEFVTELADRRAVVKLSD